MQSLAHQRLTFWGHARICKVSRFSQTAVSWSWPKGTWAYQWLLLAAKVTGTGRWQIKAGMTHFQQQWSKRDYTKQLVCTKAILFGELPSLWHVQAALAALSPSGKLEVRGERPSSKREPSIHQALYKSQHKESKTYPKIHFKAKFEECQGYQRFSFN